MGLTKEKVDATEVTCTESDSSSAILPPSPSPTNRRRTFPLTRAESWRTWRDMTREDLKSMRWLAALTWTCIALWTFALVYALASLTLLATRTYWDSLPEFLIRWLRLWGVWSADRFFNTYRYYRACQPDGSFSIFSDSYNWWSFDDFFEITIGFHKLTFSEAKVIDVFVGSVLGRLAQGIVGYVCWRVFADYLTTSMTTTPTTYTTFWLIFLHREPSLTAWLRLLREFYRGRVIDSKIAMTFMVMTVLFVLSIPTLTSSMTGYTPQLSPFVRAESEGKVFGPLKSALLSLDTYEESLYLIHDGSRIGLTDNYPVPFGFGISMWAGGGELVSLDRLRQWSCAPCLSDGHSSDESICLRANVSEYVQNHGFYGLDNASSIFMGYKLPPPALNISVSFIPDSRVEDFISTARPNRDPKAPPQDDCWGLDYVDPRSGKKPARDVYNRRYRDKFNKSYTLEMIQSSGTCQPVTESCSREGDKGCRLQRYSWGFSYIQLFLNILLYLVWTICLFIMWLKAHAQLPLKSAPEVPRGWRALIHLGESMRKDLDRRGIEPEKLTDRRLKIEIRKQLQGGSVIFEQGLTAQEAGLWAVFQSWRQRADNQRFLWWYLGSVAVAVALTMCGVFIPCNGVAMVGYFATFVSLGILWAMALGRTKTSKTLLISVWTLFAPGMYWIGMIGSQTWRR